MTPSGSDRKGEFPWVAPSFATQEQADAFLIQDQIDVTSYLLDLRFDPAYQSVSGTVTITAVSQVPSLDVVPLDLAATMTVTSVTRGTTPLAFTHTSSVLSITLDRPFAQGETFEIKVNYGGVPIPTGLGSIGWNRDPGGMSGTMVWTLSQPNGARDWWPCKDRPDDKALIETWWTVPDTWTATGNGVLDSVRSRPQSQKQFRWKTTEPLATYLVMIAATDYVHYSQTYTAGDGRTMPVDYYVYPGQLAAAQASFSNTVPMLTFFSQAFGEYPYLDDRYGMSAVPWGGAMEHATNTSYGSLLIDGTHLHDTVIAHELAHQWWGDAVTPETWSEIWLNEGFATYSEGLWAEHVGGSEAYGDFMDTVWREHFDGSIETPTSLFNATVYNKGAWILHMLRGVMGDQAFFDTLRDWVSTHLHASGNTGQFLQTANARYGGSLGWFFDEWVYGENSPRYSYGWSTAPRGPGQYRTYLRITQTQTDAGTFTMPIRLALLTGSGTDRRVVWNTARDQDFTIDTSAPVYALVFDEDDWILKASTGELALADADADGVPDRNDNCPAAPNSVQLDSDSDGLGDACDADDDGDGLDDAQDCAALDPAQGTPPEIAGLGAQKVTGGVIRLSWSAAPRADSYDIVRGDLGGGEDSPPNCLASRRSARTLDDSSHPAPGSGYFYLVRGVDAGCGGAGPLGWASNGTPEPSPCP